MPVKRLSMRKIRDVLRLRAQGGLSHRQIARSLGLGRTTVAEYLRRAGKAGVGWPLPADLEEGALERLLFREAVPITVRTQPRPDWAIAANRRKYRGATASAPLHALSDEVPAFHGGSARPGSGKRATRAGWRGPGGSARPTRGDPTRPGGAGRMPHTVARTLPGVSRGTPGASLGRNPESPLTPGAWSSRGIVGRVARVPWRRPRGPRRRADVATAMRSGVCHMASHSSSRPGGPRPNAPESWPPHPRAPRLLPGDDFHPDPSFWDDGLRPPGGACDFQGRLVLRGLSPKRRRQEVVSRVSRRCATKALKGGRSDRLTD
jgi:hypothetical protein